jgi:hypothetical protein
MPVQGLAAIWIRNGRLVPTVDVGPKQIGDAIVRDLPFANRISIGNV